MRILTDELCSYLKCQTRSETNDYFDNRLVGRLFFQLIRLNTIILFILYKITLFHILLNILQTTWMLWKQTVLILLDHLSLRENKYFRNLSKHCLNLKMLVIYWENYKHYKLALFMYFLTVIWYLKKHYKVLCLSFIGNSNNYIIALEIAYYCY